jgi:hypothetical protein
MTRRAPFVTHVTLFVTRVTRDVTLFLTGVTLHVTLLDYA